MDEEIVSYRKKDIIKTLADLNLIVVSLDRIGSYYLDRIGSYYSECETVEEYHKLSSDFLDDWKILRKLSTARRILDESFSSELGEDDMDELEREFQDLQYWTRKNPKPKRTRKTIINQVSKMN